MKISEQISSSIQEYFVKYNIDKEVLNSKDQNFKMDLSFDICTYLFENLLNNLIENIYFNFKGHFGFDNDYLKNLDKSTKERVLPVDEMSFDILHISIFQYLLDWDNKNLERMDRDLFHRVKSECYCFDCGKKLSLYINFQDKKMEYRYFNGKEIVPELNECSEKNSNGIFSFTHSFPSGKIIFANDLRNIISEDREFHRNLDKKITEKSGFYNTINSSLGQKLNSLVYSELGLVYIQVGNTSPTIFKDKSGNIIAKPEFLYDRETDEDIENFNKNDNKLGYICTDLWAVCAMDYDLYKSLKLERAKKNYPEEEVDESYINEDDFDFIVEVKPGNYKITSYYNSKEDQKDERFFTMEDL